jgi:hypothetical protein
MGNGRSSGAGVVLCLSIMGFIVCLFIFPLLGFVILFVGLAIFCALQPERKTLASRLPQEKRPIKYQPTTPPQSRAGQEPLERPVYYELSGRKHHPSSRVRIPVEQSVGKTGGIYRWPGEEEEESEVSTSLSRPVLEEEPRVSTAKRDTELGELEKELEETRSKYKVLSTAIETKEKVEPETPEKVTIPSEKGERIKDLESEEEATRVILEELNGRWMNGKIDLDMYQRLKEKYEKKIKDIQKKKQN